MRRADGGAVAGHMYNVTRILYSNATFNEAAYRQYSPLFLSYVPRRYLRQTTPDETPQDDLRAELRPQLRDDLRHGAPSAPPPRPPADAPRRSCTRCCTSASRSATTSRARSRSSPTCTRSSWRATRKARPPAPALPPRADARAPQCPSGGESRPCASPAPHADARAAGTAASSVRPAVASRVWRRADVPCASCDVCVCVCVRRGLADAHAHLGARRRARHCAHLRRPHRCVPAGHADASAEGLSRVGMIQAVTNRQVGLKCVFQFWRPGRRVDSGVV